MEITSVKLKKFDREDSRMKGIAAVVLDDCFAVYGIRIISRDTGLFLAMPSRKTAEGHEDIAHPLNAETRKMFEDAIFAEYNKDEEENMS